MRYQQKKISHLIGEILSEGNLFPRSCEIFIAHHILTFDVQIKVTYLKPRIISSQQICWNGNFVEFSSRNILWSSVLKMSQIKNDKLKINEGGLRSLRQSTPTTRDDFRNTYS